MLAGAIPTRPYLMTTHKHYPWWRSMWCAMVDDIFTRTWFVSPPKSHRFPLKLDLQQYLMGRIEHFQLALQPRRNTEPGKLWEKKTPNPVLVSYENENHQCINVAIIFTHHTKLLASAAPWNDHQLQLSNGVSTAACKMRPGNQLVRPQFFPTSRPFCKWSWLIPCWYQYFLYNLTCSGKFQRPTIENVEHKEELETSNNGLLRCLSIWLSSMERRRMKVSSA